ncbi:hypothetical protein Ddc_16217 [Ditylenchus destructor]|nr:hypothetical protein Ddc_16217 [Ditylenchus destructor]
MSEIVPTQSIKRPGSPLADGSGSEAKKLSLEKVDIPEDVWLVALKFLTGRQWSKLRFVSHQLNSLLQRNISQLPLVVIDEVSWSKIVSMQSSQQDIQHAFPVDESRSIRCDRFKLENVPSSSHNVFGNRSPKHSMVFVLRIRHSCEP